MLKRSQMLKLRVAVVLAAALAAAACAPTRGAAPQAAAPPAPAARAVPALAQAEAHIAAIAAGDASALRVDYAEGAVLHWVGGPLDGTYRGPEQIAATWRRFATAQGRLRADVQNVTENLNARGNTITADLRLVGRQTIKVRYIQTRRNGVVVSEVWQIDPNLQI